MKVMDVLEQIKSGSRVMVTLPSQEGCKHKYSLTDGTEVSRPQFASIRRFLKPSDTGLFDGAVPQSFEWDA